MHAVENHEARTLTISSTNRCKKIVDEQKTNFLVVKLIDLAEIEDLEMDLADKKVYQLIDNANEAEYYYD